MGSMTLAAWGAGAQRALQGHLGRATPLAGERWAIDGPPLWSDADADGLIITGSLLLDHPRPAPGESPGALIAAAWDREAPPEAAARALAERVEGAYALAIWDRRHRTLTLVRDAAGARTMYYTRGPLTWVCPRQAPLRHLPDHPWAVDVEALRDYLIYAYIPGDQTMLRHIRELPPGSVARWRRGSPSPRVRRWWSPTEGPAQPDAPLEVYAERLRHAVEEAVVRRMPPQGDFGVYLSGGLDSSLVTAIAARRASGGPRSVRTYAVHFGDDYPHELTYAKEVADHCGTDHREILLPAKATAEGLMETVAALDDPIGDPLTVPNLMLGRHAAREVGVILNGEGGDPLFGGPKNQPLLLHALYHPDDPLSEAYLRSYAKCFDDLEALLRPEVQAMLAGAPTPESRLAPLLEGSGAMRSFINRLMWVNTLHKGADHILTKVYNLTTAAGVIGRSPLFDRHVMEQAFLTPPTYKLTHTVEKAVLKYAVRDVLPPVILKRPKSGMRVPVQGWFRRALNRHGRQLLLSRGAHIHGFVDRRVLKGWLSYRGDPLSRYGRKIWLLMSLEAWLRSATVPFVHDRVEV